MKTEELVSFIKDKLLDKNLNPSRKKKEKWLTADLMEEIKRTARTNSSDINAQMYAVLHDEENPCCKHCENPAAFINFKVGFGVCCSTACAAKEGAAQQAAKEAELGYRHHLQRQDVRDKRKKTCMEKYGVEHVMQVEAIAARASKSNQQTCMDRYGVSSSLAQPEVKEKAKETLFDRYGVHNAGLLVGFESKPEKAIGNDLRTLGIEVQSRQHGIISPYEIDVYLPEHKLGIEVNGIRWHTEQFKPNDLHRNKTEAAWKAGIRLLHYTDIEIEKKYSIVMSSILSSIGRRGKSLSARQMSVKRLRMEDTVNFLNNRHIQGYRTASEYLGLVDAADKLQAVMLFVRPLSNTQFEGWDIIRYASNNVTGGFSKLLKAFVTSHPEVKEVYSTLDLKYGSPIDNIYVKLGFEKLLELSPDYSYVYKEAEHHKFRFRKHSLLKLGADPNLKTEHEMAKSLGIYRLYDCGKIKYVKRLK